MDRYPEDVHSTVSVAGTCVHYRRAGSGPPLLLVHGLVGSGRNWETNVKDLARHATVFALDLVNMGDSERVRGLDPRLEAEADRVAAFMEAMGLDTADIAGHSHGGAIAMMLAARHPEKVRRLILFAPANPFCELSRGLIRFYNSRPGTWFARSIPHMPRFLHDLAHRRMYVDQATVTRAMLDGYTDGLTRESIDHILGIMNAWWGDMAALRERLSELAGRSVLLIWGDRDGAVGLRSGERLAEVLGARLMVVAGTGHLPFAERPEICNEAMREWLAAT